MVDPSVMCRQHLLGEHFETHMFVGSLNKGIDLTGYILNGEFDVWFLEQRHDELVKEMLKRGYKHNSPLPALMGSSNNYHQGYIDSDLNLSMLSEKCLECRKLQEIKLDIPD